MSDLAEAEASIARRQAHTGRSCGSCSMCCYVLLIDKPPIEKERNVWCQHCRPGNGGCSIYNDRPDICRGFACNWLVSAEMGEHWFPKKAKIVAHFIRAREGEDRPTLCFEVDRRFPNRWREEPYFAEIKEAALKGLRGAVTAAGAQFYHTTVQVGDDHFLILPHREIKNPEPGVALPVGEDHFEFVNDKGEVKS